MNRPNYSVLTSSLMILLVSFFLLGCSNSSDPTPVPGLTVSEPAQSESTPVIPTPAATPNAEIKAATLMALQSFWQAMEMEAWGPASALFADVYKGERQWVQVNELVLLHRRAPDLFSAEPTFTITNSDTPKPFEVLGGDLVTSYGTLTYGETTRPFVVEVHRLNGDARLHRLHVGDSRIYSLPRSLTRAEFQLIEREPIDRSTPTSPTLLVESSIFLERVRGALFFDGMPWTDTFACADAALAVADVVNVLGWDRATLIQDYSAGLDAADLVGEMSLRGTFEPLGDPASIRTFVALVKLSEDGICLQNVAIDDDPNRSLHAFLAAYGDALWGVSQGEIRDFWCEGYQDQAVSEEGQRIQFAFEPVVASEGVVTVNGSRSDVGLFSAEMQFANGGWCFNAFTITDPSYSPEDTDS